MAEYTRDRNVNTVEYWNRSWTRTPEWGGLTQHVQDRVAELIRELSATRVVEYGFGHTGLAKLIGTDVWEGRDFSKVAVDAARAEGFRAYVTRCGDSPGYRRAFLVALEVLEHLDWDELTTFLAKSKNAPHAFFSVPPMREENDIQKHVRGWEREKEFADFLRQWWPHVDTEIVGAGRGRRMLAHCMRHAPPKPVTLTIGFSTLMDFWGSNYTLQGFGVQWQHLIDEGIVELVLVDNHPDPKSEEDREALRLMEKVATDTGARYVQWCEKQGTYPGKHQLQVEARGKWVLTTDSHVMLSRGTLETILDLIARNPESDDFYHLPCLHTKGTMVDHRYLYAIYHGLKRSKAEKRRTYGYTGEMRLSGDPYPIAAMITSAYLVRREAWFSGRGYEPILGMYGGWEGPLQVKWWLMGRRVLSLRHRELQEMPLYHWHHFNSRAFSKAFRWAVDGIESNGKRVRYHTGETKMRNYCASSAVTGGEAWVRRHCQIRGWKLGHPRVQEGLRAGLEHRSWMVENLARPEWEDIGEFFRWMKAEKIPGHLEVW